MPSTDVTQQQDEERGPHRMSHSYRRRRLAGALVVSGLLTTACGLQQSGLDGSVALSSGPEGSSSGGLTTGGVTQPGTGTTGTGTGGDVLGTTGTSGTSTTGS